MTETGGMDRNAGMYQEHFNLPLPSIENFAYNEQANNIQEQEPMPNSQHYNYDYSRTAMYGYRNVPEHVYQVPGQQHYQNYVQQMGSNQHQSFCSPMYQQPPHSWGAYDNTSIIPSLSDIEQGNASNRARNKRSRMSLQKRLLVNARERERMRVLNKAFEALRDALPCYIADGHMAKITTLRLAINYIKALTEVLEEQRELDLEKERIEEEKKGEKFGLDKLKIAEVDELEVRTVVATGNMEIDENVVNIETLKCENISTELS